MSDILLGARNSRVNQRYSALLSWSEHSFFFLLFKKYFIYLFLKEGKGERKRGRKTLMCVRYIDQLPLAHPQLGSWPATQACALTGNRTTDSLVHRLELNPLSHTSQGFFLFFFFWLIKKILVNYTSHEIIILTSTQFNRTQFNSVEYVYTVVQPISRIFPSH